MGRNVGKTSPDKLYGKPITVDIGGKEYTLNRIRIDDVSAVYSRIRDNRLKALKRNLPGLRTDIAGEALARAARFDPNTEDFWEYVSTPPGAVYIFWRCLLEHNPGITEAKVAEFLQGEEGLLDTLFVESGLAESQETHKANAEDENSPPLAVFAPAPPSPTGQKKRDG